VSYLREDTCRKGVPLRKLWTAEEARTVKSFVNNLRVQLWNLPYTQVDPDEAVIYLPAVAGGGGGGGTWTGVVWFGNVQHTIGNDDELDNWDETTSNPVQYKGKITGTYLVVNLRGQGDPIWRFTDTLGDVDDATEQVFLVADKIEAVTDAPTRDAGYKRNRHTQGDIHARIT